MGLVFKNLPGGAPDHACCAAQMFLSEGDGVVFRGANGPWKTGGHEYHLKPDAAKSLIAKVLATYAELHGGPPKELFIHGRASFDDAEWHAFEQGGSAPRYDLIGVRIENNKRAERRRNYFGTAITPSCAGQRSFSMIVVQTFGQRVTCRS